jgi:hypothetical protein
MDTPKDFKVINNEKSKQILNYRYKKEDPMDF